MAALFGLHGIQCDHAVRGTESVTVRNSIPLCLQRASAWTSIYELSGHQGCPCSPVRQRDQKVILVDLTLKAINAVSYLASTRSLRNPSLSASLTAKLEARSPAKVGIEAKGHLRW
jgi:hypothetical protein